MRMARYRAGSVLCLGLGLLNLAWVDFVLLPDYLARGAVEVERLDSEAIALAPAARPEGGSSTGQAPSRAAEAAFDGAGRDPAPTLRAETGASPFEASPKAPAEAAPGTVAVVRGSPPGEAWSDEGSSRGTSATEGASTEEASAPATAASPDVRPASGTSGGDVTRARMDAAASPEPASWKVRFAYDRATLGRSAQRTLREVLSHACPDGCVGRFRLEGHADPSGPSAYNRWLSRRRAESVRGWLMGRGFPEPKIEIIARGEEDAVPGGPGRRTWAARRRVDIEWTP